MVRRQTSPSMTSLNRRQALQLLGGAGATVALAGCQVQTTPTGDGGGNAPAIEIPDAKTKLPTDDITFRWLDGGGNRQLFQKPLFAAYAKKHTNIKIQYDGTNMDTVNETIPLGVRNGTAPDVFAIGNKIPHRTAIEAGWCRPLEDVVPDFETWKKAFPDNALVPNAHVFDGKVYSFPMVSSGTIQYMMIFNTELLKQSDVDPEADLATWDQFRAAAKKIKDAGKGKFYGLMDSRTPVKIVDGLLETAGFQGGLDYKTGEYSYTSSKVKDVIELLKGIHSDGSIWPDFAGISAADARGRMPNNVAGLQVDGDYSIVDWEAAEFDFGMQLLPTPEKGGKYNETYTHGSGANVFLYAKTKYPEVAGDLFSYIGSVPGQVQMVLQSRGALPPALPEAQKQAESSGGDIDQNFVHAQKLSDQVTRSGPSPVVRNGDISKVEPETIKPGWSDLLGGMLTGQVKDIYGELKKLNDKLNKNLDTAIADANKKGAKVSRDDYVFPNWDSSKDYTQADYDAL